MTNPISVRLAPVRARMFRQRLLVEMLRGGVVGAWLAVLLAVVAVLAGSMVAVALSAAVFLLAVICFSARAWLAKPSWADAARLVDRQYQLHDRTLTALELGSEASSDPFIAMQREDAAAKLADVSAARVVPRELPLGALLKCTALLLFAAALCAVAVWRARQPHAAQTPFVAEGESRTEFFMRRPTELPSLPAEVIERSIAARGSESALWSDRENLVGRYFDRRAESMTAAHRREE